MRCFSLVINQCSHTFFYEMKLVAGADEVGRGAIAGNAVAAAVILDPKQPIHGLTDSKKLSEFRRMELAEDIKRKAVAWAIADASTQEIDEMNVLQATLLAMERAV